MVDIWYPKRKIVLDASPVIYLAKVDSLDVFEIIGLEPLVPPAVMDEAATPALIYRHPDAAMIDEASRRGGLTTVELTPAEAQTTHRLADRVPGMHRGECEVLAIALERQVPAVIFERRGRAVARALGVGLVDIVELLFDGTSENDELERRIRHLAELTDMRLSDLEALRERIAPRRLP